MLADVTDAEAMYLTFAREEHFDVTVNGRTERYCVPDEAAAIEAAFAAHLASADVPPLDPSDQAYEAAFAEFAGSVERRELVFADPDSGEPRPRVRLDYPDGLAEECRPSDVDERIRAAFAARAPGSQPPESWTSAEHWRRSTKLGVAKVPGWGCTALRSGQPPERLDADLTDWSAGAPMSGIVEVLNRYGREGWTVVATSEDKVIYTRGSQAYEHPSRLRYLLRRTGAEVALP